MNNEEIKTSVANLNKKIQKLNDKETLLKREISELLKQHTYTCGNCHTESKISDTVFIEQYWYERPHGCTGGDNWWLSTDQALLECPHCNAKLRIYTPEHSELFAKKQHFKEIHRDCEK